MMIIFAGLVSIQGRGGQPFVGLLLAGFYISRLLTLPTRLKAPEFRPKRPQQVPSAPPKQVAMMKS